MNHNGIARIKYYKGQMLTARDFEDQQNYHIQKHKNLLQRFPFGIIGGLEVSCAPKNDSDPNDFDGFLVEEGLAVDPEGNEIIVPEEGYKVPVTEFDPEKPYLSLRSVTVEDFAGNGLFGGDPKNNRIRESFTHTWDAAPNISPSITVALIKSNEAKENGGNCDNFDPPLLEDPTGPRVRIDARVVDTDQITDGAVTEEKIRGNAITGEKIVDGTITGAEIASGAIETDHLADGAVTTDKIEKMEDAKRIQTDNIADLAITTAKIRNGAVTNEKLDITVEIPGPPTGPAGGDLSGTYPDPNIADDSVRRNHIVNGEVTQEKLDPGVSTPPRGPAGGDLTGNYPNPTIADNTIDRNKIVNGEVTQAKLDPNISIPPGGAAGGDLTGNYPDPTIQDNAVDGAKLLSDPANNNNRAVNTDHIKDDAIKSEKIAENAVTSRELQSHGSDDNQRAVNTDHIKDDAVTTAKLALAPPIIINTSLAGGTTQGFILTSLPEPQIRLPMFANVIPKTDVPGSNEYLSWRLISIQQGGDKSIGVEVTNNATISVIFDVILYRFI